MSLLGRLRRRLGVRDRKAIAAGGLVVLLSGGYRMVAAPLLAEAVRLRDAVEMHAAALRRERGTLQNIAELEKGVASLETTLEQWSGSLLPTEASNASAMLTHRLTARARESGILLQRVESREATPTSDGLLVHAAEIRALGDLEGALRFLHGLENGRPLQVVEKVDIGPAAARPADPGEPLALHIDMRVRGFSLDRSDRARSSSMRSPARHTPLPPRERIR